MLCGYQRGLASTVYKCFHMNRRSEVSANKDLTEELDKPVVIKLKKKENLWKAEGKYSSDRFS